VQQQISIVQIVCLSSNLFQIAPETVQNGLILYAGKHTKFTRWAAVKGLRSTETHFEKRDSILGSGSQKFGKGSTQAAAAEQPTWHRASAAGVPIGAISISPLINGCPYTDRCEFPSQMTHLQR
jgi:hypothetical protein